MNAMQKSSAVFQDGVNDFAPSEQKISSRPISGARVRVAQPRSQWVSELTERFEDLLKLPPGWDGYAGRPVTFNCALFAANLIERLFVGGVPAPQLVPGGDGTLQIEWHRNQYDVEIDVLGPFDVLAVRRNIRTGQVEELELQMDFSPLSEWIAALK
ncbi:MAG: hypothetical protein WAS73_15095 [Defluviicoccus sp.]